MKVFFDTSVLVASLVGQHPHHARAMTAVRRVLAGGDRGHVAGHALAETYAVLTTLPVAPRIGPEAAHKLIIENIVRHFDVVVLSAREYERLVASLSERGVAGGAVYDAIQLACATKAKTARVYTFNVDHFRRLAPEMVDVIASP